MNHISHEDTAKEFKRKLDGYTREAACGKYFILIDSLRDWLRSPAEGGGTHADRLLHDVAYKDRALPGIPISPDKFRPGEDCCLLVFCILQILDRGDLIHLFSESEKVDRLLPFSPVDVQNIFKTCRIDNDELISKFSELQYRFRPARFDLHSSKRWDENVVVPIYQKNPIKEGGTASLWQIDVPEEFVGKKLRDVASGSKFNANTDEEPDWRYQFALKTFPDKHATFYRNEMDAFFGLKNHNGMVRWLADYEKTYITTSVPPNSSNVSIKSKTQNILLEYGGMDLSVYFQAKLPPVLSWEIEAFWKSLFAVGFAVKGIHNLEISNGWETKEYFGWHADIKPDNILCLEKRLKIGADPEEVNKSRLDENEITFKLADPGFAKFVNKKQDKPTDIPKEYMLGGTATYGAPEYPGRSECPVSQAIDIWSLACVFSLAATWIVLDHEGIRLFRQVRERAVQEIIRSKRIQTSNVQESTEVTVDDRFHDGHTVLEAVTGWHKYLRDACRMTDTVTPQVLDLVDRHMLLASPQERINASVLCSKLELILESCPRQRETQLPEALKLLLGKIDEDESYNAAKTRRSRHAVQEGSSSNKTVTQVVRDIPRAERPLSTTHRQSIWPDQSLRLQDGKYHQKQGLELRTISEHPHLPTDAHYPPQTPTAQSRYPSGSGVFRRSTLSRRSGINKRHASQNYFQACDALEKTGLHRIWSRKDSTPDELLTSYFGGTRDIIFLVDNADSMNDHWYEATKLLELLVKKAKGVDENGMDLLFTTGTTTLRNKQSASDFTGKMKKARPKTGSKQRAHTDLRSSLGDILHEFLIPLKHGRGKVRDAVVIILTDGIWAGMQDKNSIAELIKNFSSQLKEQKYDLKLRPFSIQFIQFGNHPSATAILRYLDDYLHTEGIPDIIDTEHSTGDVNKMLLGSFVEEYDKDEGDEHSLDYLYDSPQHFGERTMSPESSHDEGIFNGDSSPRGIQRMATDSHHRKGLSSSSTP